MNFLQSNKQEETKKAIKVLFSKVKFYRKFNKRQKKHLLELIANGSKYIYMEKKCAVICKYNMFGSKRLISNFHIGAHSSRWVGGFHRVNRDSKLSRCRTTMLTNLGKRPSNLGLTQFSGR